MKTLKFIQYILGLYLIASLIFCSSDKKVSNWTQFRGNNLDGKSNETNVPTKWDETTNISWKTAIHGKGWSSPVVFDKQIWVTTAEEDGSKLYAICTDLNSGKIVFDKLLFEPDTVYSKHGVNSYATPTPCIEEGFVYLHFGTYGTFCLNTKDASLVWQRTDLNCDHVQGPGSSPIIYKNLIILHIEGVDVQYIIALDKKTGKHVWKTERPKECYDLLEPIGKKAYITPIIIQVDGKDLLISNGSAACIAYDPETGKEIWRIVQGIDSTIASPVFDNGTVFFYTSFVSPPNEEKYADLLGVNPKGSGDITKTNVLWRFKSPILQLLSPIVKDGLIYTIDTRSNLICIDAKTGAKIWSEKEKGSFNSSPVYAAGNIYFSSFKGQTVVIKEGKKYDLVSENKLDGEIWASPAIVDNSILIRTNKFLYRISN